MFVLYQEVIMLYLAVEIDFSNDLQLRIFTILISCSHADDYHFFLQPIFLFFWLEQPWYTLRIQSLLQTKYVIIHNNESDPMETTTISMIYEAVSGKYGDSSSKTSATHQEFVNGY